MTQDHNKKTRRQFQCRDYLWEIFEQMGVENECSTDYLINEAMRQYARSRNWGAQQPQAAAAGAASAAGGGMAAAQGAGRAGGARALGATMGGAAAAPPLPPTRVPPIGQPRAATITAGMRPVGGTIPPPLPGGGAGPSLPPRGDMPTLFVIFNGQKVPVNKEEFVIGRGSKTADLPIKDGNISRRHAAVVLQNGAFYMKDLGSTNGIEFNGERVESRLIQEGDVYQLCDYELRFTYH